MVWKRYAAIGDSFSEGVGDPDQAAPGGLRGWADRAAEALAAETPGLRYANLAIRGRLLARIVDEQLPEALALDPDLVSVSGGGNDLLRPGADVDALSAQLDDAVEKIRETGADVVLFTGVDPGKSPVIRLTRGRVAVFNENLREIAARRGAFVVDQWAMPVLLDPRLWCSDRLHMAPEGHRRVALAMLEALDVPAPGDWREPLSPLPPLSPRAARLRDARWAREFLGPWVGRRLRGRSSGDHVRPKRPSLTPLD